MPIFANVAAHAVIDTLTLLMWHQIFFSRRCRDSLYLPHLKVLVDYYLRQCQPTPLPVLGNRFLHMPEIAVFDIAINENIA